MSALLEKIKTCEPYFFGILRSPAVANLRAVMPKLWDGGADGEDHQKAKRAADEQRVGRAHVLGGDPGEDRAQSIGRLREGGDQAWARPSIPSGARSCTAVRRMATLMESTNPSMKVAPTAIQNQFDTPSKAKLEAAKIKAATITSTPLRLTLPAITKSAMDEDAPAEGAP